MLSKKNRKKNLARWIWESYFRSALLPILLLVVIFISCYFAANNWMKDQMVGYIKEQADSQLTETSRLETSLINEQLSKVTKNTQLLAGELERDLQKPAALSTDDAQRLSYTKTGEYYTTYNNGGASIYYNGLVPIGEEQRQKVARVLQASSLMQGILKADPIITSAYLITHDGLNMYYPYLDPLARFAPKFDMSKYTFYYMADNIHNPDRAVLWSDAYSSLSGKGFLVSAVAPVYSGDSMEGIVSTDVLVQSITAQIVNLHTPWNGYAVLTSKSGAIMAVPESGEKDWGLNSQKGAILTTSDSPASLDSYALNINSIAGMKDLASALTSSDNGRERMTFKGEGRVVAWDTVNETGWKLLVIVPESNLYERVNTISNRITKAGVILLSAALIFVILFIEALLSRSKKFSLRLSTSLMEMNYLIKRIAKGDYYQTAPEAQAIEIEETMGNIVETGRQLGDANKTLMQAHNEIRQKEAYLQVALTSVDDFLLEVGRDGKPVRAIGGSPSAVSEEFMALIVNVGDFLGEEQNGRAVSAVNQVLDTGVPMLLDFELPTRRGRRWYIARLARIDVEPPMVIVSIRDNTQRMEMEQSVVRARDEAESASRAKSEFLSSMSHELRTPLNAVLGFAQVLEMGGPEQLSDSQREYVGEIIKAGSHLLELINGVLDLARIEAGKLRLTVEPIEIATVIEETVTMITPMAEKNGISIHLGEVPSQAVYADKVRLKQILINLLSNAVKYNKPGGAVYYYCTMTENAVRFHVTDTGIGMKQEELGSIFDPFFRLERSGKVVEGTGVGLSIVKQLATMMGGTVQVESTLGEGSHFCVEMPRIVDSAYIDDDVFNVATDDIKPRVKSEAPAVKKVLYIERNQAAVRLIERVLKRNSSVEFLHAGKAEEGLKLARQHKPALILLDIDLPGTDGFEVFKKLRANPETKNIPVIAVSLNPAEQAINRAVLMGFAGFIPNQIKAEGFMDAIGRFLL